MRKELVWKGLDKVYKSMGYVLLDVEFLTDNLIKIYVLTPLWTIRELTAIVEFKGSLAFKIKILNFYPKN